MLSERIREKMHPGAEDQFMNINNKFKRQASTGERECTNQFIKFWSAGVKKGTWSLTV